MTVASNSTHPRLSASALAHCCIVANDAAPCVGDNFSKIKLSDAGTQAFILVVWAFADCFFLSERFFEAGAKAFDFWKDKMR